MKEIFFRKIQHWTILIAGLLVWTSCEKDVILDLSDVEGQYVIVEANITDGERIQWVKLSYSSSYYDATRGRGISDAMVKVESGDEIFVFEQWNSDTLPGYYYNTEISQQLEEKAYELSIEVEGEKFTAFSELRPVPSLDSLSIKISPFSALGFTQDTIYDIFVHFRDLPSEDNFYLFNYALNDTLQTPRPTDKGLVSDENLDETVSLAIFNINRENLNDGDEITLEIRSISRENFEFYNIFFTQTDLSGNPFAGAPPANIPTNLSAGARGFFQVSVTGKSSIIFNAESYK